VQDTVTVNAVKHLLETLCVV